MTATAHQMHFKTKELLETLKRNRTKHVEEFVLTYEGYLKSIEDTLKDELRLYKKGKDYHRGFNINLQAPVSYERQYTNIIDMLELCTDETIMLDSTSFQSYVKDEWEWKHNWTAMTLSYGKK